MKQEEKTRLTREKIIAAGIKEFGTNGYSGASVNNITGSGIPKGLLYHNYRSRDELYIECLRVCFREISESLTCGETDGIKQYFARRMAFLSEKREMGAMVLEALISPPEKHLDEISHIREPYDRMNNEWLMKAIRAGRLRGGIDADSALKYLSVMQDMFNWYCLSPKYREQPLESLMTLHEEKLPEILDHMLYGIIEE